MKGDSILKQRQYAREHLDHLRTMLMAEPRGHLDMNGALLVDRTDPRADVAVLFMHNEGKCGRGALLVDRTDPWADVAVLFMHNEGKCGRGAAVLLTDIQDD